MSLEVSWQLETRCLHCSNYHLFNMNTNLINKSNPSLDNKK